MQLPCGSGAPAASRQRVPKNLDGSAHACRGWGDRALVALPPQRNRAGHGLFRAICVPLEDPSSVRAPVVLDFKVINSLAWLDQVQDPAVRWSRTLYRRFAWCAILPAFQETERREMRSMAHSLSRFRPCGC
jgi:hypothetical protein